MKSKLGKFMMVIGAMLIAAALSLAVYNIYTDRMAGEKSSKALSRLEAVIKENEEKLSQRTQTVQPGVNDAISRDLPTPSDNGDTSDPSDSEKKKGLSVTVDSYTYIGILTIPDIGIELPVIAPWNYDDLRIAPCCYSGYANEDGFIIAAHNYSSHFGSIKNLAAGAEVRFTDVNGLVYEYEVAETELISGSDAARMFTSYPLTLFTCTFDGSERVTVRCIRRQ